MRNSCLALLGLLISSQLFAADIVPTQIYPARDDLARPHLRLDNDYEMRFGASFEEGHRYVLNPMTQQDVPSSSIRRSLSANLRLPYRFELGLMAHDAQEASPGEVELLYGKNSSKKMGGALWLRAYLVQNETFNVAVTAQYEPGLSKSTSFHNPSQDKTALGLQLDYSPLNYVSVGAFAGGSRREEERYHGTRLNDEMVYGGRLSLGPAAAQLFLGAQGRNLPWKGVRSKDVVSKAYEIGFAANWRDFSAQLSTTFPTVQRFAGVPERSYMAAIQWVMGKAPKAAEAPKTQEAPVMEESLDPIVKSQDDLSALQGEELAPVKAPFFPHQNPSGYKPSSPQGEDLEEGESDEFQKWGETYAQQKKQNAKESAQEKIEREYREQAAKDKREAEAKAAAELKKQAAEEKRIAAELDAQDRSNAKAKKQVEAELNEFTLPDSDDVNWNGLNP